MNSLFSPPSYGLFFRLVLYLRGMGNAVLSAALLLFSVHISLYSFVLFAHALLWRGGGGLISQFLVFEALTRPMVVSRFVSVALW